MGMERFRSEETILIASFKEIQRDLRREQVETERAQKVEQ